jgi:hypothetical protein
MPPRREKSIPAALALTALLAGCSPGPVIDGLPGDMGLPAGAPARPATPYQYPAVHDMPPPRATSPLNEEQQFDLRGDLKATRERQEKRTGTVPKDTPKPKSKANDTKKREKADDGAGARTNP